MSSYFATTSSLGTVRIILFRTDFADNESVANFFAFVHRDFIVIDEKNVLVPLMRLDLGEAPVPIPWHRRPSSFA